LSWNFKALFDALFGLAATKLFGFIFQLYGFVENMSVGGYSESQNKYSMLCGMNSRGTRTSRWYYSNSPPSVPHWEVRDRRRYILTYYGLHGMVPVPCYGEIDVNLLTRGSADFVGKYLA
jgi:hypothetical protein